MTRTLHLMTALAMVSASLPAQDSSSKATDDTASGFTYGEIRVGYGVTQFGSGLSGRYDAGNFGTSGGVLTTIAAYRKFEKIDHLHFGLRFRALGAAPSRGNNSQEMFFNFWGAGVSTKYFPLSASGRRGPFLQGDFNFASQFTQKYRRTVAREFDHQFAIGSSLVVGLGYQFQLPNRNALVVALEHDWASRQGEVQNIGDVRFRNRNVGLLVGFVF